MQRNIFHEYFQSKVPTLAPPAWMLQRFPMSSVQLFRLESDPNFWSRPGFVSLRSERRILGRVCNWTIGELPWKEIFQFSLFSFCFFYGNFFLLSYFGSLQDGCLTRRPQHPTSLCHPLVGTAMPADEEFWFRQDRFFLRQGVDFLWRLWEWPVRTTFEPAAENITDVIANGLIEKNFSKVTLKLDNGLKLCL